MDWTNIFKNQVNFRGKVMDAEEVIVIRKQEMMDAGVKEPTEEQFEAKKEAVGIVEEPIEETEWELKIRLRKLLKEKGIRFFPWSCANSLKIVCDKNGIIY